MSQKGTPRFWTPRLNDAFSLDFGEDICYRPILIEWKDTGKNSEPWPLEELARLRGRATSSHRVRRGRASFDG